MYPDLSYRYIKPPVHAPDYQPPFTPGEVSYTPVQFYGGPFSWLEKQAKKVKKTIAGDIPDWDDLPDMPDWDFPVFSGIKSGVTGWDFPVLSGIKSGVTGWDFPILTGIKNWNFPILTGIKGLFGGLFGGMQETAAEGMKTMQFMMMIPMILMMVAVAAVGAIVVVVTLKKGKKKEAEEK